MRDRCRSDGAEAAQVADRPREQLVVAEALEERRVVVVHAEDEAQLVDAGFALGVQDEGSVGSLVGSGALAPGEQAGEDTVAEAAGRVRCAPAGKRERVGPAWPDRALDGHASTLRPSAAGPGRAGAPHARD